MDFWTQVMKSTEQPRKRGQGVMKKNGMKDDPFSVSFPLQKRFELGPLYPSVYLTRREAQSVYYLCQGMTMRESSEMMSLSPRTVEFYLSNVKEKMGCNRKQLLLEKLESTPLWGRFHSAEHCS